MKASKTSQPRKLRKPKEKSDPKLSFKGWLTSDEEEILRRKERALKENIQVKNQNSSEPYFSNFQTSSSRETPYNVEIRSLKDPINSCTCTDFQINGLGTCKHIEKVIQNLQTLGKRRFQKETLLGSPFIEIYVDFREKASIKISGLEKASQNPSLLRLLHSFFSSSGYLLEVPLLSFPALKRALLNDPSFQEKNLRLSPHVQIFWENLNRQEEKKTLKNHFLEDVKIGKKTLDIVKFPLYPYQQEGMLHLAFNEKAMLADEMGLGKTVQAIAACELLRQLKGIERVLVVATASLKTEWEEQISKFVGLPMIFIQGSRAERLKRYQTPSFFYLTNYEQILYDAEDINRLLSPDVIILDEAQRIKNWQTKTATAVKKLSSPHAFVLTGTPLENKIDDIYSLVQFLDPKLFGSLFRFNRDFYQLDENGKPKGYKNLQQLHQRLKPILLRRLKSDVEGELPERTINHYFVEMEKEQYIRYSEYEHRVARLVTEAKKRSLRKEEFDQLQRYLACMRMICDTPYILDEDCRISPKLNELEKILEELLTSPDTKIIIFSEWARMLMLVKELLEKKGYDFAWHTGSVSQSQRRIDINKFKEDPNCRFFLSTDSGSIGLNLQVANVVINMDLPWNPAKLEQRIARAWRKHQTRTVHVINLVCQDSIEHRMLSLLHQKQKMATGVLDGDDDLNEMDLPSGRVAFMKTLEDLLEENKLFENHLPPVPTSRDLPTFLREEILGRFQSQIEHLELYTHSNGNKVILLVTSLSQDTLRTEFQSILSKSDIQEDFSLEILDSQTFETLQNLIKTGVIQNNPGSLILHQSSEVALKERELKSQRIQKSEAFLKNSERPLRLSKILMAEDFLPEAVVPLKESLTFLLNALVALNEDYLEIRPLSDFSASQIKKYALPESLQEILGALHQEDSSLEQTTVKSWFSSLENTRQFIAEKITQEMLH